MAFSPWITPDWPLPPGVRAVFTTRAGGVSAAPFESLNLGDHVGDAPASVAENRRRFGHHVGARPVFMNQVHGRTTLAVNAATPDGVQADACVTTERGVACTIMVADCLPVLLCSADGGVVAAAHAGWRGLAGAAASGGVLESVFESFSQIASVSRRFVAIKDIADATLAWLGPCIGPKAFEVGAEVRQAFVERNRETENCFESLGGGKYLANLSALARQRLAALGISQIYGNDGSDAWCTVANPSRFFSHRRDAGRLGGSGRMAAAIWRSA